MANARAVQRCVKALKKVGCPSGVSQKKCLAEMTAVCEAHLAYKKHGVNVLDFPDMKAEMNTKLAVYVPSTKNISQQVSPAEHKKRAAEVEKKLLSLFGGTTTVRAVGKWASASCSRGVCKDNIFLVESFMREEDWKDHNREMKRYLQGKKKEWGQESLTIEYEVKGKNSLQEGLHFI